MKNKPLNTLMRKIIWNNKGKLGVISIVLALAITIFTAFGFSNSYLQKNVDTLQNKYKSFDFIFTNDKNINSDAVSKLSNEFKFKYENKNVKEIEEKLKIPGKSPVVHFDNNNSFGIKYLVSAKSQNEKIVSPFIIDGREVNNDNETIVLPQLLKVTGKKIGSTITISNKKFKIVGTYSTPEYQKNVQTSLTDKNQFVIPVMVSKNSYSNLNGVSKSYTYGYFNKNTPYEKRVSLYDKMKTNPSFIKTYKLPQYKYVTKTLKYNKNKSCASPEMIKQYQMNPELSIKDFNTLASLILQAQDGGKCRSSLSQVNVNDTSLNFTDKLSQANSATDSVNTDVNDLTPHYKTAKTIPYVAKSYTYSSDIKNAANVLVDKFNAFIQGFVKNSSNGLYAMKPFLVTFDYSDNSSEFNSPEKILSMAEKGVTNWTWKFTLKFVSDDSGKKESHMWNNQYVTSNNHWDKYSPDFNLSNLVSLISKDKSNYQKEEQIRKSNIDAKNASEKRIVDKWNKNEDDRVSKLKEAKKKSASDLAKEQEKLKSDALAAKKQAEEKEKKLGIVESKFKIKVFDKYITKKNYLLNNIVDFNEKATSRGIKEQMSKQTLISTLLFVIFAILSALLIVIILQKIINDNKSEFGTLKALGIRERQISSRFIIIPIIVSLFAILISTALFGITYNSLVTFLNNNYYLPVTHYFEINYLTLIFSVLVPVGILVIYTRVSTSSLLSQKTLNLINDIKDNHNKNKPKWLIKATTTMKLQYNTIMYNKDKSLIVFSCGVIITFLISLISTMYISSVQTYGSVGKDLSYSTINVAKKLHANTTQSEDNALFNSFNVTDILNSKFNSVNQDSASKKISKISSIDLNVLGLNKLKEKGYDISYIKPNAFNSGIIIPAKYKYLYNINIGNKLETTYNGEKVYLTVSGFQNSDENIFAFTSSVYLSSIMKKLGYTNAVMLNAAQVNLGSSDDFAIDKSGAIDSIREVQDGMISLIWLAALIVVIIISPLIFILVSNIIDTNIKTISTLKAIGFRLGKIRSFTINPYIPIFVLGQFIGISIITLYFGRQIVDIFFGYFGFDVVFHLPWNMIVLLIIIIFIVYQSIIVISSQRINIVKTARILNEDSGQVRISSSDVKEYFKSSSKDLLDLQRSTFYFSWKDIPSLSKKEKRLALKFAFKRFIPEYINQWTQIGYSFIKAPINLFVETQLASTTQFTYGIRQVLNEVDAFNIVTNISSAATTYKIQFFKSKNKESFRDAIKFNYMISIAYDLIRLFLFLLLGDMIANFIDLSVAQRSFMNILVFTTFIQSMIKLINSRWTNFMLMLERKPQLISDILTNGVEYTTLIFAFFFYKWILANFVLYTIATAAIMVVLQLIVFVISWSIFRNHKYFDYVNVSVFDTFAINDWSVIAKIVKDSMPSLHSSIISIPMQFVASLFLAKFTNNLMQQDRNYAILVAWSQQLIPLANGLTPKNMINLINQMSTRLLGDKQYLKALQYSKWLLTLTPIFQGVGLIFQTVISLIPLLIVKVKFESFEYTVISQSIILVMFVFTLRATSYEGMLSRGGEYKFTNYTSATIGNVLPNVIKALLGMLNLMKFSTIAEGIQTIIMQTINRNRVKTGRWIRSVQYNESLTNNASEYEELRKIARNKNGEYKYEYTNRNVITKDDEFVY